MKIYGINHIGIAPKDPAKAAWFFREALGLSFEGSELVSSQATQTHFFASRSAEPAFASRLEILENEADKDGPIAKYLDKKGGGIHHIALAVDDVAAAIRHLENYGVQMIDRAPRSGAHNTKVAFVHPHATGGILVELVEEAR